ncbi:hypothetical protein EDC56_1217 [Sinobacterium caligoides]|uniref:Uncharacterized protein n=1 Tax=Sinobacterium caligoides TaxID=933926 RepID=A0A3N2E0L8_9GAMM|nr:phage major tail tube protein [Sinobacterium caligoides]ROS05671.1 hypothetical protein EDC56_1217 [Sinobacterium caligoides]
MLPKILKNFNLVVGKFGYAGRVSEIVLPKLSLKSEEFQLGGLDTPAMMDIGMERLECEFTLLEYDAEVIKCFGLTSSKNGSDRNVDLKFRGSFSDGEGGMSSVYIQMSGLCQSLDMGSWRVGGVATLTASFSLRSYCLKLDDAVIVDIDVDNMTRHVADGDFF